MAPAPSVRAFTESLQIIVYEPSRIERQQTNLLVATQRHPFTNRGYSDGTRRRRDAVPVDTEPVCEWEKVRTTMFEKRTLPFELTPGAADLGRVSGAGEAAVGMRDVRRAVRHGVAAPCKNSA